MHSLLERSTQVTRNVFVTANIEVRLLRLYALYPFRLKCDCTFPQQELVTYSVIVHIGQHIKQK